MITTLKTENAYRLWAPAYEEETAISLIENDLAIAMSAPTTDKRLLDAGCGTGRRSRAQRTALTAAVDICYEMLMAGSECRAAVADIRSLPFPDGVFDVIWCRLVLGHLGDPLPAYCELARACRPGGHLFVSDFHPGAVAAGHRRSFRDGSGNLYAIEHHVHGVKSHIEMAGRAGFAARAQRDGRIGPGVEYLYVRAGRNSAYASDRGLPVVAAFLFERIADAPAH